MKVKINTKEKMHVITIEEDFLAANMTEAYKQLVLPYLNENIKNLVINLSNIKIIEEDFAIEMVNIQQSFYEQYSSMVFFGLSKEIKKYLDDLEILEVLNYTLTESEAWDIVQMEEIERELLK